MKEQRTEFKKYHRLIEKHWKKVLAIILPILCLWISDMGVYSATDFEDKQMILDIENDNSYDVCMDAVYGEWEITEYIGSAMANPGISSVIPKEYGRTKEIGTVICIEEDYFKYGDNEKEDSILFCNVLPLSYPPEEICFLPCGISMKELGVEGKYFIYLYMEGPEGYVQIIPRDKTHLILSYMQELYLCERIYEAAGNGDGGFMEVSIVDSQTSYCSLYAHEWKIVNAIPYQDKEGFLREADGVKTGEIIEFSYGSEGRIWMTENHICRTPMDARVSFIRNTYEKGMIRGYGTFGELGLEGDFVTYISFDEETDTGWVKGMFIISEDKILLHGSAALYECERISEKIEPEAVMLF